MPILTKKKHKSLHWVNFRPIVTPVILHIIVNFLMQCLDIRHATEWFLAWTRKHSAIFLCQVLEVCMSSVPCRSTWKLMCCFLILTNARPIEPLYCMQTGWRHQMETFSALLGPVLLTLRLLRHVAKILANGSAAFFESCDAIGWNSCDMSQKR